MDIKLTWDISYHDSSHSLISQSAFTEYYNNEKLRPLTTRYSNYMPDSAPITRWRKNELQCFEVKCGPWELPRQACGNPPAGLNTFALWADPGHGQGTNHGIWRHCFFHKSTWKGCFPIEAGNYTMSTNPCWQTSTTALSGDGKLFWFVWQKQITPHVTMPVSLTARSRANVGGVLYCVLPPWGYWQEVSSTWEKPIYSTCTSCWLMNIVGLWKTSLSVYF